VNRLYFEFLIRFERNHEGSVSPFSQIVLLFLLGKGYAYLTSRQVAETVAQLVAKRGSFWPLRCLTFFLNLSRLGKALQWQASRYGCSALHDLGSYISELGGALDLP